MLSRKLSLPDSPQPLQIVFDRAARKLSAKMSVKVRTALLFALASLSVQHATCDKSSRVTETGALRYLSQFGYLPPANPSKQGIITEDAMSKAILDFQSFAGLNLTGQLDDGTVKAMLLPRCGVKDRVGTSLSGRSKRYALQGSRWRVKKLTYRIGKYPQKITDKAAVDKEIAKAFAVWSAYTDLTFTPKKSGQVHIEIRFEKGEHGDGDPFDGPGGTLAHAYFPLYGGDAHFDDSEHWTINSFRGTNLFQVAAHEFGHSLGLSHSDVKSALMAPFYRGYNPAFTLDSDDISGIQALYGPKTSSGVGTEQRTTITPPAGKEDSQLCNDPKVDTMFNSAEGQTYAFKGDYYWKLTAEGVADGYPKIISQSWKGLPGNIDAAFTYKNGKTYFFKGSKYWRFIGKKMDGNYPKEISEGFTGIPDNLDAATTWTGNGKIYFYKGTKFWRFDPNQKPPVKSTYPKLISNWEGLPDNLDAALTYQGYTYFFKGNAYYRFNDRTFAVDRADPAFPRAIAYWWFGCRSARKGTLGNTSWKTNYDDDDLGYFSSNLANVESHFHDDEHDDIHDDADISDIIVDAGEADEHRVTSFYETATVSSARGLTSSPLWLLLFVKLTLFVTTYTNVN